MGAGAVCRGCLQRLRGRQGARCRGGAFDRFGCVWRFAWSISAGDVDPVCDAGGSYCGHDLWVRVESPAVARSQSYCAWPGHDSACCVYLVRFDWLGGYVRCGYGGESLVAAREETGENDCTSRWSCSCACYSISVGFALCSAVACSIFFSSSSSCFGRTVRFQLRHDADGSSRTGEKAAGSSRPDQPRWEESLRTGVWGKEVCGGVVWTKWRQS